MHRTEADNSATIPALLEDRATIPALLEDGKKRLPRMPDARPQSRVTQYRLPPVRCTAKTFLYGQSISKSSVSRIRLSDCRRSRDGVGTGSDYGGVLRRGWCCSSLGARWLLWFEGFHCESGVRFCNMGLRVVCLHGLAWAAGPPCTEKSKKFLAAF